MLVTRLELPASPTRDRDAELIGRFATAAMLPRIKRLYQSPEANWDCAAEDGFLRYFLREDIDYGVARVAQKASSCTPIALNENVRLNRQPSVEPSSIAGLENQDLWAARGAAEVLAAHGAARAKQALLRRLRAFNQQWQARASEFHDPITASRDVSDAISFQYGLLQSLGHSPGWTLDESEIAEIETLALGEEQQNIHNWQNNPR